MEGKPALLAVLVLMFGYLFGSLFGSGGASQEKYDALTSLCEKEKAGLGAECEDARAASSALEAKAAECEEKRSVAESLVASQQRQMGALQSDSDALSEIVAMGNRTGPYALALEYYNDAFGEGKVPNTAKINRIEAQTRTLGPDEYALWRGVINCEGLSDCESAKKKFVSSLEGKIAALEHELAAFVQEKAEGTAS